MVFQKMNNVLIKHGKTVSIIFLVIIIIAFVWYFTPGVDGSILFGRKTGAKATYGQVLDNVKITFADVSTVQNSAAMLTAAQYGLAPNRVSQITEDEAFQLTALLKIADSLHVLASNADIAKYISSIPSFRENDKFSAKLYETYKNKCLAPLGYGYKDFEQAIATFVKIDNMMDLVSNTSVITDDEIRREVARNLEKVNYRMITFPPVDFEKSVEVTDAQVKEYYDANPKQFMTEPQSDGILAVSANADAEKKEVTDEQVKEYYELVKDTLLDSEGKVQTLEEATDYIRMTLAESGTSEAAYEKMSGFNKAFREFIRMNKEEFQADPSGTFRKFATENKLKLIDIKDLNASTASDSEKFIDSALVNAVTGLQNVNSYTNMIREENATVMFLLTVRRPSELASFNDVQDKAKEKLVSQKAAVLAEEAAAAFRVAASESKDLKDELEDLVKNAKGSITEAEDFTIGSVQDNPYIIYIMPVEQIMKTEAGKLSAPDNTLGSSRFAFVNTRTEPTAEEIDKEIAGKSANYLNAKKSLVRTEFQNRVYATVRTAFPSRQSADEE